MVFGCKEQAVSENGKEIKTIDEITKEVDFHIAELSKEEMIKILTDLELLDAKLVKMKTGSASDTFVFLKDSVYKKHDVTEEKFEKCYGAYFKKDPLILKEIYEQVYDNIKMIPEKQN